MSVLMILYVYSRRPLANKFARRWRHCLFNFFFFYWPNKKKSHCRNEVDVIDTNAHTHTTQWVWISCMPKVFTIQAYLIAGSCLETKTNRTWICVASELTVSVSKPDRLQCENYTTYSRKELCVWVIFAWEFEIFSSREKVTQPEKMTTKISWASNDLESMMLFLSISIYLA